MCAFKEGELKKYKKICETDEKRPSSTSLKNQNRKRILKKIKRK
jgi:hypothetical protein